MKTLVSPQQIRAPSKINVCYLLTGPLQTLGRRRQAQPPQGEGLLWGPRLLWCRLHTQRACSLEGRIRTTSDRCSEVVNHTGPCWAGREWPIGRWTWCRVELLFGTVSEARKCPALHHLHTQKNKNRQSKIKPFNFHQWSRYNFSLHYQYNINQISDESKEKYQFGDN